MKLAIAREAIKNNGFVKELDELQVVLQLKLTKVESL